MSQVSTHPTLDEAIAIAISESAPGDVVVIHDEACEVSEDDGDTGCTCEPTILHVGAAA